MYKKVIAMKDINMVEIVEEHPCPNGSEWVIYQYKRTSPLILSAWREGNKHHFVCKVGKANLKLIPSLSAGGIEEIKVDDKYIYITYAGLAGAGVGALLRKDAENVVDIKIIKEGGGSKIGKSQVITHKMEKIIVGIDDTDNKDEGATWVLAHKIGEHIEKKGLAYYLDHTIVQLYPGTPDKTQNCVSIALSFAVLPENKNKVINEIINILDKESVSDNTAIAVYNGLFASKNMRLFTLRAKREVVSLEEAKNVAEKNNIKLIPIRSEKGLIGAVAALGLAECHKLAARLWEDIK